MLLVEPCNKMFPRPNTTIHAIMSYWMHNGMCSRVAMITLQNKNSLQKLSKQTAPALHIGLSLPTLQNFIQSVSWWVTNCSILCSRAAMMTLQNKNNLQKLTSLALCAGFDMVSHTTADYIQVFVQQQQGFFATYVPFLHDQVRILIAP